MIRIRRFKFSLKNTASFFAFERSERQRRNDSKQTRNAKLVLVLFAAFGILSSCAQYQEPEANCFAFRASVPAGEPDCIFAPLGAPEDGIEV